MTHVGEHARTDPDRPAVVLSGSGSVTTYRDLDRDSAALAGALRADGIGPGDCIALLLENSAGFFWAAWAAQRSGLHYTPLNTHLTVDELAFIVRDSGSRVLITSSRHRELATRLPVALRDVDEPAGDHRWTDDTEGAVLLYSSGTTGRPKGVRMPMRRREMGSADAVARLGRGLYGFRPGMVYLNPAPLYHGAPLNFTMAVHRVGGTVVVMDRFDPVEFLAAVQRFRATHAQVVPTMLGRILKLPREVRESYDLSSLECVVHASAPCPIPVKEAIIDWWGPIVHEYYSGTEGNGFVAIDSTRWLSHKGSVGRALVGRLHILDEDGTELPPNRTGLVYFESAAEFEYLGDPEKTAAVRTPQGWSTLGDIGHLDEDGYLYLTDRASNVIISGGVNIYPQETENVLSVHPQVADVAVIGVPDEDMGEQVKAVVVPLDPAAAGPDLAADLVGWCRDRLSSLKCPRSVDFRAELPRDPNGKLYKRTLKDEYWQGYSTLIR